MTNYTSIFKVGLLLLFTIAAKEGLAQPNTGNTDNEAKFDKDKERPERTRLRSIIKNDTKNILYGNKCFEDFTAECGYEYVVTPKGDARNQSGFSRFFHNFGVKTVLLFKNGPFWKIKENKKKEQCINLTRDLVGP